MQLEWNPDGIDDFYLASLNRCFPGWGGMPEFAWCFRRRLAGMPADLMVLRGPDGVMAGSAVTYARLAMPDGRLANIACMTASWTLPSARNQGCFGRIIEASVEIARKRECELLVAYLAASNLSRKPLLAAGAGALASAYFVASAGGGNGAAHGAICPSSPEDFLAARRAKPGHVRYSYTDPEWRQQFIGRPTQPAVVSVNNNAFAVVEKKGEFDRILALEAPDQASHIAALKSLRSFSANNGRKLFSYTTEPDLVEALVCEGFEYIKGWVIALPTGAARIPAPATWPYGRWSVANGDRM